MPKHHDLKCFTKQFQPIVDCEKRSIVRYDDRKYQKYDTITLREGHPEADGFAYTGRSVSAKISDLDDFGCQPGYLNLSLSNVGMLIVKDGIS